jgi:hypothetical protein
MAVDILANRPVAVIALKDATWAEMGLDATNILVIYLADNPPYSWNPSRLVNSLSGIIKNQGYFIYSKVDLDLSEFVVPPLQDVDLLKDWVITNFASLNHTHPISDIIGLQDFLDTVKTYENVTETATSNFTILGRTYLQNAEVIDIKIDEIPFSDFSFDAQAGEIDFSNIGGIYSGSKIEILYRGL